MKSGKPDEAWQRMPVWVLTGFLGSGKTTVLNHLLQHAALRRSLVLINEFGAIGLDHDLVANSHDDVFVQMMSGCLCCAIRGDLAKTLRDAPWRFARGGKPWFDRVIIETTGLADPAPILQTLMTEPAVARSYCVAGVFATIDAVNGDATLDRHMESVKQAAVAERLLVTKTDLASADSVDVLRLRLRALNPTAPQIVTHRGAVDPVALFENGSYDPLHKRFDALRWLNVDAYDAHRHSVPHDARDHGRSHEHNSVNRHDDRIKALCVTLTTPIRAPALIRWLEALTVLRGADLLRIKGIVNVEGLVGPVVIHGVQHVLHAPLRLANWPSSDRRSRIVFITRDIDESDLRDTLNLAIDAWAH